MDRLVQVAEYKQRGNTTTYIITLSLSSHLLRQGARSIAAYQIYLLLIGVLVAATACNREHVTTLTPEPTRLTADLVGELLIVDECLRVNAQSSNTSYLLAWPPDLAVRIEKDTVQILDENGQEIALQIGEPVYISGGEVHSIEYLDERVRQKLPARCPGPYWLVGNEIRSVNAQEELK